MSAPWTTPCVNPAGWFRRSKAASARLSSHPMRNPTAIKKAMRASTFGSLAAKFILVSACTSVILGARMIFRTRSTQPEHFDDPARDAEEFRSGYLQLARVNELFRLHDPYTRILSRWLGDQAHKLSILDLGAGDGWLGRAMESWAASRGTIG